MLNNFGPLSTALYDGNQWTPFAHAIDSTGDGITGIFVQNINAMRQKIPLAVPIVILIAIGIALGIVFLLVLAALALFFYLRHKRAGEGENTEQEKALLATSTAFTSEQPRQPTPGEYDIPEELRGAITTAALSGGPYQMAEYQTYYAQFPFKATEPGELEFEEGDKIYVLDNTDELWWMGMVDNGPDVPPSQGVFPASYVSRDPPPRNNAWGL